MTAGGVAGGVGGALLRGAFAQHRGRVLLGVAAIALGVALGYAVQLINTAAVDEMLRGARLLSGSADLVVEGPRSGFDELLYPAVARLPGVAVASPVVEVEARLAGRDDVLRIVGVDVFQALRLQPGWAPTGGGRLDLLRPDAVFLSPAAARALALAPGDTLEALTGLERVRLAVAGIVEGAGSQRFAVMDIAGAQTTFARLSRLSRIDLRLAPGTDAAPLRAAIVALLPPGVALREPAEVAGASADLTRAYRVNLNVLALVALFTGGLLVFSTQALSVVRRRSQLALFRVLGLTRRRLVAALAAEGAAIGAAGSALGLLAGYGMARVTVGVLGADLGSGYFRGVVPTLRVEPDALAVFFVLGVATAVAGALLPALEAAAAAPAAALKAGDEQHAFARLATAWPGWVLLVVGALASTLPAVGGLPLFGYAAIACLLLGTLLLLPRFARVLLAALATPRAIGPALALAQLRGAPGQATVSLAAIVASVGLMVSMAIMVASFRTSVDSWLVGLLPADLYLRAGRLGDSALLQPADQQRITALPGLRRVDFQREEEILLDARRPRVALLARTLDPLAPQKSLPFVAPPVAVAAGAPPPLWASESAADAFGLVPGATVEIPLGARRHRFTVGGIWRDYSRPRGALVIERNRYVALTGDASATQAALWFADEATAAEVRAAIARDLPGADALEIASPGEIREVSLAIFDRTFAITYALEFAAMAIGLVGLSSSFAALVLARRREFGMLRHLGVTRGEIRALLATEGALVSGVGVAAGMVLGGAIGLILIRVVNRQSFHWGMDLAVPWPALVALAVAIVGLSVLTAVVAGRSATSAEAVRAVREDW
jgi:putative ABC transport system permease protein